MNKFYSWLSASFFLFSQNTHSMENSNLIAIGDINECLVRTAQIQDHNVWEVHDPKCDSSDEFNSLTAKVYPVQGKIFVITSMKFSANNDSKIRAVNAFFKGITIGNTHFSSVVYVWVNDSAEIPYSEALLGKLLITRFDFEESDGVIIENFTPQTLGQGGFLRGNFGGISKSIIR